METTAATILIADDNEDDVFLLKRLLETNKVTNPIQIVRDGEETLCYLKGEGVFCDRELYPYPLLLFLDYKMPRKNGLEVLQWVRHHAHASLRVVLLTGLESKLIHEAYRLGAASFLVKPMQFKDFLEVVHNVKGLQIQNVPEGYLLESV